MRDSQLKYNNKVKIVLYKVITKKYLVKKSNFERLKC